MNILSTLQGFLKSSLITAALALPTVNADAAPALPIDGQVTVVDFWASWCAGCQISLPYLNEIATKYGAKGVKVVTVNVDENSESAKPLLQLLGKEVKTVFDPKGELAEQFGVKSLPSTYFVAKGGNPVAAKMGYDAPARRAFEASLDAVLKGGK